MPYKSRDERIACQKRYYQRCMADPVRKANFRKISAQCVARLKQKDPRRSLLFSAQYRAKKMGLPINISLEDIIIPTVCPVLGLVLVRNKKYGLDNSISLDRVDPTKGYVKGNIAVMSHRANRLKDNATIEELRAVIAFMAEYPSGGTAAAAALVA